MTKILKAMAWIGALCGVILATSLMTGCHTTSSDRSGAFAEVPGMPGSGTAGSDAIASNAGVSTPTNSLAGPPRGDKLEVGVAIKVIFSDIPIPVPPFEERVKVDGTITLLQNQTFQAAGKSRGDLEKEVRARYVPDFFKNLTVTIQLVDQFYFVDGEVKAPARQIYLSRITVLKAIASCGGFTDFAKKSAVKLIRADGTIYIIDCKKALKDPRLDLEVFSGDTINVPRSPW